MPAVTGHFHAGITVSDMDASLAFYRDGLGLEVEFDVEIDRDYLRTVLALDFTTIRAAYLRIPGTPDQFIELLEYRGIERLSAASRPCDPGAGHVCLYVDDVEAMHARLVAQGHRARSATFVELDAGPNRGARSCYMLDPDGYAVELFQRPAPPWPLDLRDRA
jgi:catechol 2,3-dioxygenase-like lactoylglutathione lyase family enzyme